MQKNYILYLVANLGVFKVEINKLGDLKKISFEDSSDKIYLYGYINDREVNLEVKGVAFDQFYGGRYRLRCKSGQQKFRFQVTEVNGVFNFQDLNTKLNCRLEFREKPQEINLVEFQKKAS